VDLFYFFKQLLVPYKQKMYFTKMYDSLSISEAILKILQVDAKNISS